MKIDFESRSKYENITLGGGLPIYSIEVVNGCHLYLKSNEGVWHFYIDYDGQPCIELIERS